MGHCNGFRSTLCQLVRIFTAKLVMKKSGLLCTKFVGKDTTRRTTPGAHHVSKSHAKELEKLAADRLRETEKKATDDVVNTPKHNVLSMHDNFSQEGIFHYWGGSLPGHAHVNQLVTYPDVVRMWRQFHGCPASRVGIK
jgi:hypothetical protein